MLVKINSVVMHNILVDRVPMNSIYSEECQDEHYFLDLLVPQFHSVKKSNINFTTLNLIFSV